MKKASWIKYLVYILLIIGLLLLDKYIQFKNDTTFGNNLLDYRHNCIMVTISTIFSIIVGICIGLEYLLVQAKKHGRWKFNWLRAIILLIPSFYIIIFMFVVYWKAFLYWEPSYYIFRPMWIISSWKNGLDIIPVFRVLFGYWFITSFYKQEKAALPDSL